MSAQAGGVVRLGGSANPYLPYLARCRTDVDGPFHPQHHQQSGHCPRQRHDPWRGRCSHLSLLFPDPYGNVYHVPRSGVLPETQQTCHSTHVPGSAVSSPFRRLVNLQRSQRDSQAQPREDYIDIVHK
jgi:hypothetical protein